MCRNGARAQAQESRENGSNVTELQANVRVHERQVNEAGRLHALCNLAFFGLRGRRAQSGAWLRPGHTAGRPALLPSDFGRVVHASPLSGMQACTSYFQSVVLPWLWSFLLIQGHKIFALCDDNRTCCFPIPHLHCRSLDSLKVLHTCKDDHHPVRVMFISVYLSPLPLYMLQIVCLEASDLLLDAILVMQASYCGAKVYIAAKQYAAEALQLLGRPNDAVQQLQDALSRTLELAGAKVSSSRRC